MKHLYLYAVAALAWQSSLLVNIGAVATPEHLRYQRAVLLPSGSGGLVCAPLDATVLGHTASGAHDDLRIFRADPGRVGEAEVSYLLTESGPEPVGNAAATVEHMVRQGDTLQFDLRMPPRPYSEVQLQLHAHDFVGTVKVYGTDPRGRSLPLGIFGIFDLSQQHLGRWTVLPMAETSLPVLHLALNLRSPAGVPVRNPSLDTVAGAAVPPSRERQTVYTPVASTQSVKQQGNATLAVLHVPAHVPVEELRFGFPAGFQTNFAREVTVRARPDHDPLAEPETIDAGILENVSIPSGDPGLGPISVHQDSLDATLGATLAGSATVRVLVANHGERPLPIRDVSLEMRERKICFLALPGSVYTLRYGDPALAAPLYDNTSLSSSPRAAADATLGPELRNPRWQPRRETRPFLDRHPEAFWVAVLLCAGMMAGSALHFVQHREETRI